MRGRSAVSPDALPPNNRGDLPPKKDGDFPPSILGDFILLAPFGGRLRSSSPELESLPDADSSCVSSALPFDAPPSSSVRGSAPVSQCACLSFFPFNGASSRVDVLVSFDVRTLGASACVSTRVVSVSGLLASGSTRIGGDPGRARFMGGVRPMDP